MLLTALVVFVLLTFFCAHSYKKGNIVLNGVSYHDDPTWKIVLMGCLSALVVSLGGFAMYAAVDTLLDIGSWVDVTISLKVTG